MSTSIVHSPPVDRPKRKVLGLGVIAVVAVLLVAACNVTIDGNTLTVVDAQEEAFYSNGDEPYVAVIQFRVTPGVPGSTSVNFLGNLQEVGNHMYDGSSRPIPDAMAATNFPNVHLTNINEILAGRSPELVGAVTVALESDNSPWSAINGIMNDVRNELDAQLRTQIEPLSFADILTPGVASERLAEAARRVEAAASPSFWRAVGIFFSSFGDPDDVIGFKVLFFAAVTGQPLMDALDAQLSTLPPTIVGGPLRSGPLDVDYSGDGATYRIRWDVSVN